uniref:Sec1 family domain-containing protein 1 n=1 Tax=Aceria tosichella TaxID=561515 RepID=A0A6G1SPT0_9ACAR
MTEKLSIRKKQIQEATAMLNLNADLQLDWKFLIYDNIGENIIAPLFTIEDLENLNVTSHLRIQEKRDSVPDVSAVYFVLPTDENIERICQDLASHLYDSYYLNFISPISRSKLEAIADAALLSDSANNVKKVYDQYLNFIALEDDFFILREKDKQLISYYAINRSDATDAEITSVIDQIVEGLFSVLVALNIIPIIRCPKGGPAEAVAEKLTKKIRETLRDSRNNLFANNQDSSSNSNSLSLSIHRPLLCLVDRSADMSTPLHHTWTYQALIHDLLNAELNKVSVVDEAGGKVKSKVQTFDLNPNDKFWRVQRGSPFPQVADAVQRELDDYKRRENEVKSPIDLNSPLGLDGPGDESAILAESTAKLTNTMSSLQELLENKRVIGNHTTIAHAVLDEIKKRKLDNFFEIEEKIMNRNLIDRVTLDDMIANPDYGHPSDKYRLFLISYICDNPNLTEEEAEKYVSVLEGLGCKRSAFDYIKRWKTFSKINVASLQSSLQSSGGVLKTAGMFTKLMSQGSQFVMEGVKNLVLKEHYLPITKIVDGLMDSASKVSQESLEYTYFDPKVQKDSEAKRKRTFQNAIVFIVGGGNYIEYQNLVDYCNTKSRSVSGTRHIIYGSTDLMNANQFLQQLSQLGDIC